MREVTRNGRGREGTRAPSNDELRLVLRAAPLAALLAALLAADHLVRIPRMRLLRLA